MTAWALAQAGHRVELFERDRLIGATSSASTKLLHGGLRYLETGQFRFVREALQERAWWVAQAPHLARPIEFLLPIYADTGRPAWQIRTGIMLYDLLALGSGFPRHRRLSAAAALARLPGLRPDGLEGGFCYYDAQMDDYALGLWAAAQAQAAGVRIHEGAEVSRLEPIGKMQIDKKTCQFDCIVNVAGPWALQLLNDSGITSRYRLDLVRGSHILFDEYSPTGCFLQVRGEKRIFFVLPYQGKTLVGTTEVRQEATAPVECTRKEAEYLLTAYNSYFSKSKTLGDICGQFAGLRPLIYSAEDPSLASREYVVERTGKLISVFGGKWTTARQLGNVVARQIGEMG